MNSELHKGLYRQLVRVNLSEDSLPTDIKKWRDFLDRINRSYHDADQERYLLERSMEISSREMQDLNSKLEEAQELALLGYWYHDRSTGENIWSKELYKMFKLDFSKPVPDIDQIYTMVHDEDVEKIKYLVNRAFLHGEKYDTEIRIRSVNGNDDYRWYHVIGKPRHEDNKPIHLLTGVAMDITERKIAELEVASLQQQLINSARRAGMADVATSILHNVGNVLNSVNVSIHLINEYMTQCDFKKLLNAENMIVENRSNIEQFLNNNDKGKLIPQYLISYTNKLNDNYNRMQEELKNLHQHVEHIKTITEMQKSLSGVSGVFEKIYLPDVIDTALKMCGNSFESKGITLVKEFEDALFITTDKSKFLQIMVNLLQNARDSLYERNISQKKIIISISRINNDSVSIQVKDNGVGIDKDNLTKIFAFGFTTKKMGHGFGLHSSALAATEIGGKLEAASPGTGQGAIFALTLPIVASTRRDSHEHEPEPTAYRDR
jgi:signal transduction histidine kinase